jgi:hypothetical protein
MDTTSAPLVDETSAPLVDETSAPLVDTTSASLVHTTSALPADSTPAKTSSANDFTKDIVLAQFAYKRLERQVSELHKVIFKDTETISKLRRDIGESTDIVQRLAFSRIPDMEIEIASLKRENKRLKIL